MKYISDIAFVRDTRLDRVAVYAGDRLVMQGKHAYAPELLSALGFDVSVLFIPDGGEGGDFPNRLGDIDDIIMEVAMDESQEERGGQAQAEEGV